MAGPRKVQRTLPSCSMMAQLTASMAETPYLYRFGIVPNSTSHSGIGHRKSLVVMLIMMDGMMDPQVLEEVLRRLADMHRDVDKQIGGIAQDKSGERS